MLSFHPLHEAVEVPADQQSDQESSSAFSQRGNRFRWFFHAICRHSPAFPAYGGEQDSSKLHRDGPSNQRSNERLHEEYGSEGLHNLVGIF
jgi:hypothetical protein